MDSPASAPPPALISKIDTAWALAAFLALGYLFLFHYTRSEGIPLRVHGEGLGRLVPWVAGTLAAIIAIWAGCMVVVVRILCMTDPDSDLSMWDQLLPRASCAQPRERTQRRNFLILFLLPGILTGGFYLCWGALRTHLPVLVPGGYSGLVVILAIMASSEALGLWLVYRRRACLSVPRDGWKSFVFNYLAFLGGVHILCAGLPFMALLWVIPALAFTSEWQLWACGIVLWLLINVVNMGILLAVLPRSDEPLVPRVRRLMLAGLIILSLMAIFQTVAAPLGGLLVRAMGLGGRIPVAIELTKEGWASLPALGYVSQEHGTRTVRAVLVLDAGNELWLRPCAADKQATSSRAVVVPWNQVTAMTLHANDCNLALPRSTP